MEEKEVYTITIVRNIGVPISFTIRRRKALFFIMFSCLFIGFLIYASSSYLILQSKSKNLSQQLTQSQKKVKILSNQISKLDHDRYWSSEDIKAKEQASVKTSLLEQTEFSTEGIWTTDKSTLSDEELQEGTSVEVDRFSSSVKGDDLHIRLKIINTSYPIQLIGGYICITLVNRDYSPPLYRAVTKGELGVDGYPSSYKTGRQYLIKRRSSTKRFKFNLTEVNEYYTDAVIFLYSYKGRLLNRQVVELKKEIFLE